MTNPWTLLLNQAPASHHQGLIPLSDYRIVTVSGPDAFTFLQGQCTCDFNALAQGQWVRGAHCNPKGRMISSFVAAQIAPEVIGLRVHHSIAQQAHSALSKYLVFSKAKCVLSHYLAIGFEQKSAQALGLAFKPNTATATSLGLLLAYDNTGELWIDEQGAASLLSTTYTQLASGPLEDPMLWQQLMVEQGIAEVTAQTTEQYLPQAFNYDAIGAVSFKKGCYTGQEIIARLHYKGQSKQRLHKLLSPVPAELGQPIVNSANKVVGQVINAVEDQVLACTSAYHGDEPLFLADNNSEANTRPSSTHTQPLSPMALPYTLP